VVHPLTGAATIVGGVGAAADSDVFHKQSGEIIASAIQTARENQANQIEKNLRNDAEYNIYRAQRDVAEYHNMCSLETGLSQIRAALKATSPDAGATPPAAQGTQANTIKAAIAADASNKATAGAAAGAFAAQSRGLSPSAGAALGAVAGASSGGGTTEAAEAGAAAVPPAPAPSPRRLIRVPPPPPEAAAARVQLFIALGQGPERKNRPDPARVSLMKQCWNELLHPVPTNFSLWLDSASSATLASVTDCINRRSVSLGSGRP
jgi:hypothetical protein